MILSSQMALHGRNADVSTLRLSEVQRRSPSVPATVLAGTVRASDLFLLLAAGIIAEAVLEAKGASVGFEETIAFTLFGLVVFQLLANPRAYGVRALQDRRVQLRALALPGAGAALAMGAMMLMLHALRPGRVAIWLAVWALSFGTMLLASRFVLGGLLIHWRRAGRLVRRVAVVGVNDASKSFIRASVDPARMVEIVGVYGASVPQAGIHGGALVRGGIDDLLEHSRKDHVDGIVFAPSPGANDGLQALCERLKSTAADIFVIPSGAYPDSPCGELCEIAERPVLLYRARPLNDWQQARKRVFDVAASVALLVALSPLLLLIALAIRLDSPGPILFRQPRTGFRNNTIIVYKFRTMHSRMTDLLANVQTKRNDPRVTRVGKWLRKTSLDELPQLWNVLSGSMSLVGPRPHAPNTKAGDTPFHQAVAEYALRHRVKPGITGWAQVNGWRGETRTLEDIRQRVRHDLYYIENWTLALDLKILLMTPFKGLVGSKVF